MPDFLWNPKCSSATYKNAYTYLKCLSIYTPHSSSRYLPGNGNKPSRQTPPRSHPQKPLLSEPAAPWKVKIGRPLIESSQSHHVTPDAIQKPPPETPSPAARRHPEYWGAHVNTLGTASARAGRCRAIGIGRGSPPLRATSIPFPGRCRAPARGFRNWDEE